jgi:hypothetical protein
MSAKRLTPNEKKLRDEARGWAVDSQNDPLVEAETAGLDSSGLSLDEVTALEIAMAENPDYAGRLGIDSRLIRNGLHTSGGSTVIPNGALNTNAFSPSASTPKPFEKKGADFRKGEKITKLPRELRREVKFSDRNKRLVPGS